MALRVIAGEFGGRHLVAPDRARPTTDRVREALFSVLGNVDDVVVLDLFAGSGALAIEALSRGAGSAVLVDRDADAVAAMGKNLDALDLTARARVERRTVKSYLTAAPPSEAPFALVFLDPPYDTDDAEVARTLGPLGNPGWLTPDARVVVERPATAVFVLPADWVGSWSRTYGDTLVVIAAPPQE